MVHVWGRESLPCSGAIVALMTMIELLIYMTAGSLSLPNLAPPVDIPSHSTGKKAFEGGFAKIELADSCNLLERT